MEQKKVFAWVVKVKFNLGYFDACLLECFHKKANAIAYMEKRNNPYDRLVKQKVQANVAWKD